MAVLIDMEQVPSQQQLTEYLRAIYQLHLEVSERRISDVEFAKRLAPLQAEHKRLVESGVFPLKMKIPFALPPVIGVIGQVSAKQRAQKTGHALDFKCQCKTCVKKHTISMEDRTFLARLGITWSK